MVYRVSIFMVFLAVQPLWGMDQRKSVLVRTLSEKSFFASKSAVVSGKNQKLLRASNGNKNLVATVTFLRKDFTARAGLSKKAELKQLKSPTPPHYDGSDDYSDPLESLSLSCSQELNEVFSVSDASPVQKVGEIGVHSGDEILSEDIDWYNEGKFNQPAKSFVQGGHETTYSEYFSFTSSDDD